MYKYFIVFAVLFICSLSFAQYLPDTNTVALWHLDETSGDTAYDFSSNNLNAAANGTSIIAGKIGNARKFTQADEYLEVADNPLFDFRISNALTCEFWLKLDSIDLERHQRIIGKWGPGYREDDEWMIQILEPYNVINFQVGNTSVNQSLLGRTVIKKDVWYHVAAVWNGNTGYTTIYLNGIIDAETTFTEQIGYTSTPLRFGWHSSYIDPSFGFIKGSLDEVRISKIARLPSPRTKSVFPVQNSLNISKSTNISAIFNVPMNTTTLNSGTIFISGSQSGLHTGAITIQGDTAFTFDPDVDFKNGEFVTVCLTKDIVSTIGDSLTNGYQWNYTIQVPSSVCQFVLTDTVGVGTTPDMVVSGDFNNDGNIDLAVTNMYSDNISVLKNDGTGDFLVDSVMHVGTLPQSTPIAIGDLEMDGDLDIVVTNRWSESVSVLFNNGIGKFTKDTLLNIGTQPISACLTDIDGDGDLDLAIADYGNGGSDKVYLYLNNGEGHFELSSDLTTDSGPVYVSTGDLDLDGDLDLVVVIYDPGAVTIFKNDGAGNFTKDATYTSGTYAVSVAVCDLNNDGNLDLAVSNCSSGNIITYENNGSGSFTQEHTINIGGGITYLTVNDFNGDGYLDLAVPNYITNKFYILLNDHSGNFSEIKNIAIVSPNGITSGDYNNDGIVDIAVSQGTENLVSIFLNQDITSGLVAYYPFNGNSNDESGNGHDGIVNGAVLTNDRFGSLNSAYSFDGVDDYIQINNSESLNPQSISISAMVYADTIPDGVKEIIRKDREGGSGYGEQYALYLVDDQIVWNALDLNPTLISTTNANLQIGIWYHVVATYDAALHTVKIFLNGVPLITDTNVQGSIVASSTDLTIGSHPFYGYSYAWDGKIDDIRIYNRALTTFEVEGLYNYEFLPVQIVSFTAIPNPNGAGVKLEWTTISEINNYGFYVERRSESEQNFTEIPNSFIAGHGTSTEVHDYSFIDNTLTMPGIYHYRLRQLDNNGLIHYSNVVSIKVSVLSVVENVPAEFLLIQNYPNPFNPSTTIKYGLPEPTKVKLTVHNMLGKQVAVLVNEKQDVGYHHVEFNGTNFSSGVYFYRIQAGRFIESKKFLLIK